MSLEGAILKLGHELGQVATVRPGATLKVPLTISRSAKFDGPVRISLDPHPEFAHQVSAEVVTANGDQSQATLNVVTSKQLAVRGEVVLTARAVGLQDGKYKVVSQVDFTVCFK